MIKSKYDNKLLTETVYYKLLYNYYESSALAEFEKNSTNLSESHFLSALENLENYINNSNMSAGRAKSYRANSLLSKIMIAQSKVKYSDIV